MALSTLESLAPTEEFEIEIIYIDGNPELEKLYGEQVPVTHINGEHHDFWRVDSERFKACLAKSRQRQ